ncbi:MAG: reverse transcriptase domain-containing protein [Pyrinomonadaceae bacterium]|nr:reverse transcriptase domain-containing protein [Pyrinomonadaceae bacterium]
MAEMFDKIVEIKSLYNAWRKVRANKGSAGIDQISWFGFEQKLDANLAELSRNLQTLTYQPLPAKFVSIAKANGKTRELGILAIRDRVAQRAVLDQIEPIFEAEMSDCNYAFRQGRNCEMAIQRILLNRANGDIWTVESDIQNYFGEIDIRILLNELNRNINDDRVLRLIELWLEAGILRETDAEAEKTWWQLTQENLTEVQDALGETVNQNLDEFISTKLGLSPYEAEYLQFNPEVQDLLANPNSDEISEKIKAEMQQAKSSVKREALKKLLESGLLYALSNRAMLAKFVGMKALGIGGFVLASGMFAPKDYDLAKNYFRIRKGILQGSPISPLLANIYLNNFDKSLTNQGLRLVRYCDDFVITCKNQAEAENALAIASRELSKVKLSLHPDKTRIISPKEEFEFLGYRFGENGAVYPPASVHEKYARQIKDLALKAKSNIIHNAEKAKETYSRIEKLKNFSSLLDFLNRKK